MIFQKWYAWPFGIVAVIFYGISCYHIEIYGEMSLQIIYVILAIYGFINWKKGSNKNLKISQLNGKQVLLYLSLSLIICAFTYKILQFLQGALPVLDAITNGFAIVATYLAAKKVIENWFIWVPVNILTVYMMMSKDMPFYAVLYSCYGLFAILGYIQWKRSLNLQNSSVD